MTRNDEHLAIYPQLMWPVFQPTVALDKGQGALVWDVDGRQYLDLMAGIAVNQVGHAHPKWVAAVAEQAGRLAHTSNLYTTRPQLELAVTLATTFGLPATSRVFFANSGSEANEAALKVALRLGGRRMLALEGSFHGRTEGALAVTSKAAYRRGYEDYHGPVTFLPHGDLAALEAALGMGDVAGLFVEVIQGEAGMVPLPIDYLARARQMTRDYGVCLIVDEVQSGMGRTGTWLAHQNPALVGPEPIVPDVVTLAKGLGGGFPIGACLALTEPAANALVPGDHGNTFGGNPLACAAALATIEVIKEEGLLDHATQLGQEWSAALMAVPGVQAVRGRGLMLAIEFGKPLAAGVAKAALEAGFLVNAVTPTAIRVEPPLILSFAQAELFTGRLPDLIAQAETAAWVGTSAPSAEAPAPPPPNQPPPPAGGAASASPPIEGNAEQVSGAKNEE